MIGFANDYLDTGNATQAALNNYDTDDYMTAAAIGSENLRKPQVIEYMESKADVVAKHIFKLALEANNETVQLNASKDILDRAGFKPIDRTASVKVTIDTTDNPKMKSIIEEFRGKAYEALKQDD